MIKLFWSLLEKRETGNPQAAEIRNNIAKHHLSMEVPGEPSTERYLYREIIDREHAPLWGVTDDQARIILDRLDALLDWQAQGLCDDINDETSTAYGFRMQINRILGTDI